VPKFVLHSGYSHISDDLPKVHDNSLLDRIYKARGIKSEDDLDYNLSHLLSPDLLRGMDKAVALLIDVITNNKKALVVSDYDCDGATSCCIAVEGLRMLGAKNIDFIVPNRFEYGYGLSPAIVKIAGEKSPDLIITVDNGISSLEGAQAVKDLKTPCKLLITDHHLAPKVLPEADAIVNPNQPGCDFPSKSIAGCGVMFYTLLSTRVKLREIGWFTKDRPEPNFGELLDVLALGTVADVVPLDYNNRIFVHQGLKRINAGNVRPGIAALLEIAKRKIGQVVASDFGFAVGPRLNAAGRLADMSLGILCLLEKDEAKAKILAAELDNLNCERREIESQMKEDALVSLNDFSSDLSDNYGICLYQDDWHEGVIGILASRIKEKMNRPVVCFAKADDGSIKGSARSVPAFHIRDALDAIATKNPGLLTKFGGHAMAAGMSLRTEDLERFTKAFDIEARIHLTEEDIEGAIETDGDLKPEEMTMDVVNMLRESGPWGQMFPDPSFEGVFEVLHQRVVGDNHLKLLLRHQDGAVPVDAICFNCIEDGKQPQLDFIRAAYKLDVNEFRGRRTVQAMVSYFEAAEKDVDPPF